MRAPLLALLALAAAAALPAVASAQAPATASQAAQARDRTNELLTAKGQIVRDRDEARDQDRTRRMRSTTKSICSGC